MSVWNSQIVRGPPPLILPGWKKPTAYAVGANSGNSSSKFAVALALGRIGNYHAV